MKKQLSLAVIVTALNEEKNIVPCVVKLQAFLEKAVNSYQIIVVDDGSTDNTWAALAPFQHSENIITLKLEKNGGVGASIKRALAHVETEWFCWFPSDLEFLPQELLSPIKECDDTDIVTTYAGNALKVRSLFRYLLSKTFNTMMNQSFGLNLKYFNGITLYKKKAVEGLTIHSNRFFFHAELLVKCLKKGCSFKQVPLVLSPRNSGKSNAIKWPVFLDVATCYLKTFHEMTFKR